MKFELDWLKRWNIYAPERLALKCGKTGEQVSYARLFQFSNRIGHELKARGVKKGDRVAVLSKNNWAYVPLFMALQRVGAVMVPINYRLTPREVSHILTNSEPSLFLVQDEFRELAEAAATPHLKTWSYEEFRLWLTENEAASPVIEMDHDPEDPCLILYTSGTTGAPKGAIINARMLFWNSLNTSLRLNLSERDIHVSFMPFFHTGGWNVLVTPFLHRGATTIILEKFDAEKVLRTLEGEKATILFGVPTMLDILAREPNFNTTDLNQVRYAVVGGEPMPLPLIRTWQSKGIPVRQGYGLTEFGPNVFSLNEEDSERKIGSIGFPNFYIDTRVVTDDGHDCRPGEIGELWLRGPACTPGYWRDEQATRETIQNGWLRTGDLVRTDKDGYVFVVGRKKDMFISGGENVYPAEVEQFLRTHPAVQEVALIGVPDPRWGEVGKAFVVKKPDHSLAESDLSGFCAGQLAKYKIPKYFTFLNELPKGDSGKLLKRALRDAEMQRRY